MIQHRIIQYHIIVKPRTDFILSLIFKRQNNSSFGKTANRSDLLHQMLEYEHTGKPFDIF